MYTGWRIDRVAAYDFEIPDQYEVHGDTRTQRCFVLLDEHIQIQQPLGFLDDMAGWWYVDLVEVTERGDEIRVADHWLDVIVPPPGLPYRLLDLDELGDALLAGKLSPAQAADGLVRFQRFLDTYLHGPPQGRNEAPRTSWFDFPPAILDRLAGL